MSEKHSIPQSPEPLISVVMPVYNAEAFLDKSLGSVLKSTVTDLEIICIDDGSDDRSLSMLHDYASKDDRFRILTQNHLYAGAARNAGILAARGKYIHFLDADDSIVPEAYEKLLAAAEAHQVDVCECLYRNISSQTDEVTSDSGYRPYTAGDVISLFDGGDNAVSLLRGHVVPWNKLYLRNFLLEQKILYDDLICAEDRSFYYEVIIKARRIFRIDDRLMLHRINISTSLDGSDIRLRHFDVEFRSFERIWDLAKDLPDDDKKQILESCIGDSYAYYVRAVGTPYRKGISQDLQAYWKPYLPMIKENLPRTWWYPLYRVHMIEQRFPLYGRCLLSLAATIERINHYRKFPMRHIRGGLRILLRLLTGSYRPR